MEYHFLPLHLLLSRVFLLMVADTIRLHIHPTYLLVYPVVVEKRESSSQPDDLDRRPRGYLVSSAGIKEE